MRALRSDIDVLRCERWTRGVRWVGNDQLHLTLRFIGDITAADADRYVALLRRGMERLEPVAALALSAPRLFPSASHPRVIARVIARVAGREPALLALVDLAERSARAVGQAAEARPFNGHITLGRTPRDFDARDFDARDFDARDFAPAGLGPLEMDVGAIAFFESTLTPRGPVYRRIAEFAPR